MQNITMKRALKGILLIGLYENSYFEAYGNPCKP